MTDDIIFLGTSKLAADILQFLNEKGVKIKYVITQPDKKSGRGKKIIYSPVKQVALDNNIDLLQPDKIIDIYNELKELKPKLMVLIAYGQFIPKKILDIPPLGIMNLHPSLLPKYRGPSPIKSAILNGEKETGISFMILDNEMDHGPLLNQNKINLSPDDTITILEEKILSEVKKSIIQTINDYLSGTITPTPQDHYKASYCKLINKEDGHINWQKTDKEIYAQIRAFINWPKSYTFIKDENGIEKQFIIKEAEIFENMIENTNNVGLIKEINNNLYIKCSKKFLKINKIQPNGKGILTSKEFISGYKKYLNKICY